MLVAGGDGSSAELYGFATVKTDKDDYSPGMTVRVSGSGWQPNQPVTFYLRELPAEHYARLFTIEADSSGNIDWTDLFLVEDHHLGVHFLMTAGDGVSQAHMAFTDSNPQTIAVAAPTSVTVVQGGTGVYGNVTVTVGGNTNPCAVTLPGTTLPCRRALWQCLAIVHRQPPEQISFPHRQRYHYSVHAGRNVHVSSDWDEWCSGCQGPGADHFKYANADR